jgi:hypothetical protein
MEEQEEFLVHTEDLNSLGFWVKTDGIDLSAFLRNPICLWNHSRADKGHEDQILPIGIWEGLTVLDNGNITATPKFDMDDEFAAKIANKVKNKFIRGASVGLIPLEWSYDEEYMKPGQSFPTLIRSQLREISICDIPSNGSALILYSPEGQTINLSESTTLATLPVFTQQKKDMNELQVLALSLGLAQTASLSDVQAKLTELKNLEVENLSLKTRLQVIEQAQAAEKQNQIKLALDTAITDGRISAEQRPAFEKLFAADFSAAQTALAAVQKPVSLSAFAASGNNTPDGKLTYQGKTFSQLSKEAPEALLSLKENNLQMFKDLYKAEFGKEYKQ